MFCHQVGEVSVVSYKVSKNSMVIDIQQLDIYYHGIHTLEPSITSIEHIGPNPHATALMRL